MYPACFPGRQNISAGAFFFFFLPTLISNDTSNEQKRRAAISELIQQQTKSGRFVCLCKGKLIRFFFLDLFSSNLFSVGWIYIERERDAIAYPNNRLSCRFSFISTPSGTSLYHIMSTSRTPPFHHSHGHPQSISSIMKISSVF